MSDLLEDVSNFLDITWDMDIRERKKLSGIVERGKSILRGKSDNAILKAKHRKKICC